MKYFRFVNIYMLILKQRDDNIQGRINVCLNDKRYITIPSSHSTGVNKLCLNNRTYFTMYLHQ